jgi:PleD family two-component response regulator
MTGNAGDYGFSDIIDAGATDFIAKPFSWGELKAKIERIEKEKEVLQDLIQLRYQTLN